MRNLALLLFLLLATCLAHADEMIIETYDMKSRTAGEVIPLLKPVLHPEGSLTGRGFLLIIKTTPENYQKLLHVLKRIDKRPQMLVISVRQASHSIDSSRGGRAHIHAKPGKTEIRGQVYSTDERGGGNIRQRLRVLEGNIAFIKTGKSVPVGQRTIVNGGVRDTVTYKPVTSGFYVKAFVNGNLVRLVLSTSKNTLSRRQAGAINTQSLHTVLNGETGKWITVGGTLRGNNASGSGTVYRTDERRETAGTIQIRVDIAR